MELDQNQIQSLAASLSYKTHAIIDGKPHTSHHTFTSISPIDNTVLGEVINCDAKLVDEAVHAARQSFESGVWRHLPITDRKAILLRAADIITQHHLEIAVMDTTDMGKPIQRSVHDVSRVINRLRWKAESLDKLYDKVAPSNHTELGMITREPYGVVGCVTPWNFPFHQAAVNVIPALVMGNSVVLKPAEQSPSSAIWLAEIFLEAGLPAGVFNVVPGLGELTGQAMGLHDDIDMIAFTGSVEIAKQFQQYAGQSNMKSLLLESGGKSPNIIFDDYHNLDKAALASAHAVFNNQGEICCAPTRILVEKSIYAPFIEKLIEASKAYAPTNPLDPTSEMGAMVDENQTQRVMDYIQIGQSEGAIIALGGQRIMQDTHGCFIEPTIFTDVKNHMRIAQEEIFGPVINVTVFDTEAEAIELANDTEFGLAATVWTHNINRAHRVVRALQAGTVSVNTTHLGNESTAFGGFKQSGIGRNGGVFDLESFSQLKTTWIDLNE